MRTLFMKEEGSERIVKVWREKKTLKISGAPPSNV
jgi:hypothetical protein